MKKSSKRFKTIFEDKKEELDSEKLIISLNDTVLKIARASLKKFKYHNDTVFNYEDVAQEIRIHLWDIFESGSLDNMPSDQAYKYITTASTAWAVRYIHRVLKKDKKYNGTLLLSIFNVEYLNITSDVSCEVLVRRLKDACSNIENADKVFSFLAPEIDLGIKEYNNSDFAGLKINAFYNIIKKIKEQAKEISYE